MQILLQGFPSLDSVLPDEHPMKVILIGIGSNGLTSARHELLSKHYAENYPETFDPLTDSEYIYCGPHRMDDQLPESELKVEKPLSDALIFPLLKKYLKKLGKNLRERFTVQRRTDVSSLGTKVKFVKDNLFQPPPIFKEAVSKTSTKEMFQVYNMGHRLRFSVVSF